MRWLLLALFGVGCRLNFDETGVDANLDQDSGITPSCTGHDEDADGFPDACDVCPTIRDGTQRDGDGDGVGDACDPRPAIGGDYIHVLDVHTGPAATYYLFEGDNAYQGDMLRLGTVLGYGRAWFDLTAVPTRIEIRVRVIATSTTEHVWFGVWYNSNVASTNSTFATGNQTVGDRGTFHLKEKEGSLNHFSPFLPEPAAFVDGATYTMVVRTALATGNADELTVISSDGSARTTSLTLLTPRDLRNVLEVQRAVVDFEYLAVYAIR